MDNLLRLQNLSDSGSSAEEFYTSMSSTIDRIPKEEEEEDEEDEEGLMKGEIIEIPSRKRRRNRRSRRGKRRRKKKDSSSITTSTTTSSFPPSTNRQTGNNYNLSISSQQNHITFNQSTSEKPSPEENNFDLR